MIMAFMPPVSAISVAKGPGLLARVLAITVAVALEPVNATPASLAFIKSFVPRREPEPGR